MSNEAGDESKEVHCLRASLSVHDFESVGGLSARADRVNTFGQTCSG